MTITPRRAVALALLTALWLYGAWATRHVDSDIIPATPATPIEVQGEDLRAWQEPSPRAIPTRKASRSRTPGTDETGRLTDVTCYVWTGNRTASGLWPKVGMAASNRHPFGTRLRVQNVGVVTVQDRIGHSSSLDIYFANRAECLRFGRQQLRVAVVR